MMKYVILLVRLHMSARKSQVHRPALKNRQKRCQLTSVALP
jgi:hypothetical protein